MQQPNHTGRDEWRRGWPLVLGALIGMSAGPGLFQNLSSLFVPGLCAEFGWTRGQIATAAGLGLLGGVASPFLGRWADRIGARPMIVGCMLLLALAYVGLATMTGALWQYQLLVTCLAFGVPGTSSVVYGRLIAQRFRRQRGLALGLATSGLSVSTLLMPPVAGTAIAWWGWRAGFLTFAVYAALIALPLVLFTVRRAIAVPVPGNAAPSDALTGVSGAQSRRDGRLWRLGLTALCINFGTIGLVTQLVPFGIDRGLGAGAAALLLIAFGASQIVGRLLIGTLVDHYPPQRIAAVVATLSAGAFVLLQAPAPGLPLLAALVFVAGLMNGAEFDLLPFFAARLFGVRAYGEIYGTLVLVALVGTAAGIVGFGRLYDATGGYGVALGLSAAALLLAALLFLSLHDRAAPHGTPPA